jgi:hypothetical protein
MLLPAEEGPIDYKGVLTLLGFDEESPSPSSSSAFIKTI